MSKHKYIFNGSVVKQDYHIDMDIQIKQNIVLYFLFKKL